jgi:hypothetical protein
VVVAAIRIDSMVYDKFMIASTELILHTGEDLNHNLVSTLDIVGSLKCLAVIIK